MGYLSRDVWKGNAGVLAMLVIVVGGSLVGIWALAGKGGDRPGPGGNGNSMRLTVEGSAPQGAAITVVNGHGRKLLLESDATLPFHQTLPLGGSSLYQLQAQLPGSGNISCRIAVGSVVSVHHATGAHACDAGVSYARFGWSPS